jgi:2-hydroxy-6-oxonona-2,4-dienedioate hydrolase
VYVLQHTHKGIPMQQQKGQIESRWITAGGFSIHARVSPAPQPADALPVVLVHGLTVSSRYMVPLAELLAPHHRVLAPDLPGYGRSAHPPHALSTTELADALAACMDSFAIPRAALVGQSMGCQTIVNFALRHPGMVAAAVLIGPTVDRLGRTPLEQARRLAIDGMHTPASSLAIMLRDFVDFGPLRTLKTLHYTLHDQIEQKLPLLRVPVLLLRGERDPVSTQRWVEELAPLLYDGQLHVLPGATHAAHYAKPCETARLVLPFLQAVQSRAGE